MYRKITILFVVATLWVAIVPTASLQSFAPSKPSRLRVRVYEPVAPLSRHTDEPRTLRHTEPYPAPHWQEPTRLFLHAGLVHKVPHVRREAYQIAKSVQAYEYYHHHYEPVYLAPQTRTISRLQRAAGIRSTMAKCTVRTSADSGPDSLRQCLLNATQDTTIDFDPLTFPPATPATISLVSYLPYIITDSLTITAGNAGVILDGSGLSEGSGLVVDGADGVAIQGLQIVDFPGSGIVLSGGASNAVIGGDRSYGQGNLIADNGKVGILIEDAETSNNQVLGNYIGTDVLGLSPRGNKWGVVIRSGASDNIVGGSAVETRNLISGNVNTGVVIQDADTSGNQVLGNDIGIDGFFGLFSVSNYWGVVIALGAQGNIIGGDSAEARNIISGNSDVGILILDAGTSGNQVQGNYVGTDTTGVLSVSNTWGIVIASGAQDNIIGGDTPSTGNVISGNTNGGISIEQNGTSGNQVQGNYIGIDQSGTNSLSNGWGVAIVSGAQNNVIGGGTEGARNVISGNYKVGIQIQNTETSGNRVLGNYIGTNAMGTTPLGNEFGVVLTGAAKNNQIGDSATSARNLISGNTYAGVQIELPGTNNNQVLGNYFGTDCTGMSRLANGHGVSIGFGARDNVIGGTTKEARNIISGNNELGVFIHDAENQGTTSNQVLGNFIGTDVTGAAPLSNQTGVFIGTAAKENVIGGDTHSARNLISGNTDAGVMIQGIGTTDNQVIGNYIGTDFEGKNPLGNFWGVAVLAAQNNKVGDNLISGNLYVGVQIQEAGTTGNQVSGNYIGTDSTGTASLSNFCGVSILAGAKNNTIGGETQEAGNLISGNTEYGISIQGQGASGNQVKGNFIGTDVTGAMPLGNTWGVSIGYGAQGNTVGGEVQEERNIISGNIQVGVQLQNDGTSNNVILGNFIGTDTTGRLPLSNTCGVFIIKANQNVVGGNTATARNLISGNTDAGIAIQENGAISNTILGNYIGTDVTGLVSLGNKWGVVIGKGAQSNVVGGDDKDERNIISGNTLAGVQIQENGTTGNTILGNNIGTNVTGTAPLSNAVGIVIGFGADGNVVGGTVPGARNIISGNSETGVLIQSDGTVNNIIQGNHIGTDFEGMMPLGNRWGVGIIFGAQNNVVGGGIEGAGNLVSGNTQAGISIKGDETKDNQVLGNRIGTDATGTAPLGNADGVFIGAGASDNVIGGDPVTAPAPNIIGSNTGSGIVIDGRGTNGNQVQGNSIGFAVNASLRLGNKKYGVHLENHAQANTIGISNTIVYNGSAGVAISGEDTRRNTITRNIIHSNGKPQIHYVDSPAPIPLTNVYSMPIPFTIWGTACPNCIVEIFANPTRTPAGTIYLGTARANHDGGFIFEWNSDPPEPHPAITVTDEQGTTSEFHLPIHGSNPDPPWHMFYLPIVLKFS